MCLAAKMRVSSNMSSGGDIKSDTSESNTCISLGLEENESEFDFDSIGEKFRVDRKQMEKMLQAPKEGKTEAEIFFQQIMTKTSTVVSWPAQIKIGAKNNRDPYVTIRGKTECVEEAKILIMEKLDVKADRVTLKMDVPHTDHSHIIGRKGYNIQSVMNDTSCHIHFPDTNRKDPLRKSNVVTIAAQPQQVEMARERIREMVPLNLAFQVPIQVNEYVIRHVEERYNVSVQAKPNSYSSTIVVRGNEIDANLVKEATAWLMEFLISPNIVPVTSTMEVTPDYVWAISGTNGRNIELISHLTGAKITMPEPNQGTITISGSIEGVHLARQKIIGSLPLLMSFDYDKELDPSLINRVMDEFDVVIAIRPKQKQLTKSITIKGKERKVGNLFQARRSLLKLESIVQPRVPPTYALSESTVPARITTNYLQESTRNPTYGLMNLYSTNQKTSFRTDTSPPNVVNWASNFVPVTNTYRAVRGANWAYSGKARSMDSSGNSSGLSSTRTSPNETPPHGSPVSNTRRNFSFFGTEAVVDKDVTQIADRSANTSIARLQELFGTSFQFSDEIEEIRECEENRFNYDCERKVVEDKNVTRVPSNNYVGYGFSQSMPAKILQEQKNTDNQFDDKWVKRNSIDTFSIENDLEQLLMKIKCDKYIPLFNKEEVDLETFLKLDENHLTTLGIPYGPRLKMMIEIKSINQIRFSPAPGAERESYGIKRQFLDENPRNVFA